MRKIVVYADGSYRLDKQANATIIFDKDNEINKTLIYRVGIGTNNQAAELNSVIHGLEYIKEFVQVTGEECFVEIRCDELSIIDFIRKNLYNRWDRIGWRKRHNPIRTNVIQWYMLMSLINYFGQQNIRAIKVKSKMNSIHNSVDRVAHKMLDKDFMDIRQFYKVSVKGNMKKNANIDAIISKSEKIEIPEFELDRSQPKMPWCQIKIEQENKIEKKVNKLEYTSWTSRIAEEIISIPTKDIVLEEELHLSCTKITFSGMLKVYKEQGKIDNPVAVRKIADNKYALVMGVQRYFAAKILNIEVLPAVITNYNNADFAVQMQELINK